MTEDLKIICKKCGKEHFIEFYKLFMTQDFILHNRPSLSVKSSSIPTYEYKFDCSCGHHFELNYNCDYDLYHMIETSEDGRNGWGYLIDFKPENIVRSNSWEYDENGKLKPKEFVIATLLNDKIHTKQESVLWKQIYMLVSKIPRARVEGDAPDAPSVATELENLFLREHTNFQKHLPAQKGSIL